MVKCECCGAPLEEGAVFCGECGTVIPKQPTQYNQEPAPEEPYIPKKQIKENLS